MGEIRDHGRQWLALSFKNRRAPSNFGDQFSRLAVEIATGQPTHWSRPHTADVWAIGSLLDLFDPELHPAQIWGTGERCETVRHVADAHKDRFLAVRGPLTLRTLGLNADCSLGDPGLLIKLAVRRAARRSGVVVVPHFTEVSAIRKLLADIDEPVEVLSPNDPPLMVAARIASSSAVISTGLHGCVFAHALSTPCVRLKMSMSEPEFKFDAGGHEILPVGGHGTARWWPTEMPTGGRRICPR